MGFKQNLMWLGLHLTDVAAGRTVYCSECGYRENDYKAIKFFSVRLIGCLRTQLSLGRRLPV